MFALALDKYFIFFIASAKYGKISGYKNPAEAMPQRGGGEKDVVSLLEILGFVPLGSLFFVTF